MACLGQRPKIPGDRPPKILFPDGGLVAEVHGSDTYYAKLRVDASGRLEGVCTCPVGVRCKHCVALALTAAKRLKAGDDFPEADLVSRRWKRAAEELADLDGDFDCEDGLDDEWEDEDAEAQSDTRAASASAGSVGGRAADARKRTDIVADHLASLDETGLRALADELLSACPDVRPYLKHKLEMARASVEAEVRWPLPRTGLPPPKGAKPNVPALLEIALEEKRGTDVWSLYEQLRREAKDAAGGYGYSGDAFGWRVADAVAKELPEEALKIWDGKIRANVASAHESCYQTICKALEKMRPVMVRLGKGDDWKARVAELRTEYKRRSKFTAMLDALTSGRGASSRIADW